MTYGTTHNAPRQIRVGNRTVGHVAGGVFIKKVSAARHFLQRPPAIAFDGSSLDDAEQAGAKFAEVYDRDTGRTYRASLALIRRRGFELDRGFGRQIALPLGDWRRDDEPAGEQLGFEFSQV